MDGNNFKFYLNLPTYGRVQIAEPLGWDGAAFTVKAENYGRDVSYANEEVSLYFGTGYWGLERIGDYLMPDGAVADRPSSGFDFIMAEIGLTGFESEIEFIIERNGFDFTVGQLEVTKAKTDGLTYFECKVVQEPARAVIKRNAETKINLFGTRDINGADIDPVTTVNVLVPALPQLQSSKWTTPTGTTAGGFSTVQMILGDQITVRRGVNPINVVDGIGSLRNELSFISPVYFLEPGSPAGTYYPEGGNNFTYYEAQEESTNVNIKVTELEGYVQGVAFDAFNPIISAGGTAKFVVVVGTDYDNPRIRQVLWQQSVTHNPVLPTQPTYPLPTDLEITIPVILAGERVYIYVELLPVATFTNTATASYNLGVFQMRGDIQISATATGTDSVTSAVRLFDAYQKTIQHINGMPLHAPRMQPGGEMYDNVLFNGFMMRGFEDKPFTVTWKQLIENLFGLVNYDSQVCPDRVFIGHETDFYANKDLGYFLTSPDVDYSTTFKDEALTNIIDWRAKNYRKNDNTDDGNLLNSIHTGLQLKTPNKLVEGQYKIETDFILDPHRIEEIRKQNTQTGANSSASTDDNIILLNVTALPPGSTRQMTRFLLMRVNDDDTLDILNSSGNGEPGEGAFSWDRLGFTSTAIIIITGTDNAGLYTIANITPTVLTVVRIGPPPSFSGRDMITITYPLNNVSLIARTNQGVTSTGLDTPERFSNQLFNPVRLIARYWGNKIDMICAYRQDGVLRITEYINSPDVTITVAGEPTYSTTADLPVSALAPAVLDPKAINTRLIIDYPTALNLYKALDTVNADGTIGGFMRILDPTGAMRKVYLRKSTYQWATNVMDMEDCDVRLDAEVMTVTRDGVMWTIDEVGYDERIIGTVHYKTIDDFIWFEDGIFRPLTRRMIFSRVSFNGVIYDSLNELIEALDAI